MKTQTIAPLDRFGRTLIATLLTLSVFGYAMLFATKTFAEKQHLNSSLNSTANECVILLHGLARTDRSMAKLDKHLKNAGYKTANIDYPSRQKTIEELAYIAVPKGLQACAQDKTTKIHFVTHSMGGIVLRYYLEHEKLTNLGRVVMLSPPNQGSPLVDEIGDWGLYKSINGPAGQQLGTDLNSVPLSLGPVDYPVGIITGNKHSFFDAWAAKLIPGEDDGKVSIEGAKVAGMSDFLVVPYTHSFIMNKKDVLSQSVFFLLNGSFKQNRSSLQSAQLNLIDDPV